MAASHPVGFYVILFYFSFLHNRHFVYEKCLWIYMCIFIEYILFLYTWVLFYSHLRTFSHCFWKERKGEKVKERKREREMSMRERAVDVSPSHTLPHQGSKLQPGYVPIWFMGRCSDCRATPANAPDNVFKSLPLYDVYILWWSF